ncbi:MAG: peptidoglycan-binding protein [Agathobacter sp.]|nr:peptidoglycan-binding protein [Lachnobacterium sp.]MDY6156507.1 peptidoglycan-binding protein [Agathobacter sp.]
MKNLHILQQESVDEGKLQVRIRQKNLGTPVSGASVRISFSGDPDGNIEEAGTDESGNSQMVTVKTPPLEYSMEPNEAQPYSEVTVTVSAQGYREITVSGVEVLPNETSIQEIELEALDAPGNPIDNIVIPAHTLYGDYPAKIPEAEVKSVNDTGEIVLSRVVIPEFVIVHDGVPTDPTAKNYYIRYRDYIKNVASSEIYATWPDAAIRANVLAIMSFTLNRIYTEWYRGKGYNFNITSSTAYDHKFIYGRNIYTNISKIVNEMFENYLSRPNVTQPILTQYCDGQKVSCPTWMTQWGAKNLGDQGYSPIEILRHFYGSNMYINVAEGISGIPASWPGYDLTVGSRGNKVYQMQQQLARIAKSYPAIPVIVPDGIYGNKTREAVEKFQSVFGLPVTGIVDYNTWYEISNIYVAVTRIAELM